MGSWLGLKATGSGATLEEARNNAISDMQKKIVPRKLDLIRNVNSDGAARDSRGNLFEE